MLSTRPSLAVAGAVACATVALWVSFGALAFVDAGSGAAYVGILPSPLWLAALLVVAGAFTIIVRPSSSSLSPLWLSAALLLPWLPFRLPLSTFIWTGNAVLWLWIAITVALLAPSVTRWFRSSGFARLPPRKAAFLAGVLSAAALGLGAWAVAPQHPNGDEPHYLIITQSLLEDHDLKIENNHRQGDYRAYSNVAIKPDFLKRGKDGQIYSIHAPGLSLLVAPAFALFGYPGVMGALVLAGAAASALVWLVAWRVTGDRAASWFGWAVFALSVPFFFHAPAVFPDGLGAVLTAVALLPLVDARAQEPRRLIAVGAALAVLPWLSSRFVVLAAMSGLVIAAHVVATRPQRASRLAALAVCPLISGVAFLLFFQIIYGTPNPSVVYAGSPTMTMTVGNLRRGVPGLLFDQQFGIVPNAPVFLCAFAGIAVMIWRGPRRLALDLLAIAVPYYLVATSFYSWWGGTTPPARYFVPIAPLMAVPAAYWFATAKSVAARTASLGSLIVSLLITATMASVGRGAFVFNFRDGMSRVALWLSPVVDLTKALPSLFQNPPRIVLGQVSIWLAALAIAVAVSQLLARLRPLKGVAYHVTVFGLALEVMVMTAVSLVWRSNHTTVTTPYAAGAVVLRDYEANSTQLAVAYRPFRLLELTAVPGRIVLARTLSTTPLPESTAMAHLPAGIYEVTGTALGPSTGHVRLRTDRVSGPIADWDAAPFQSSWTRRVTIPVPIAGLQLEIDPSARRSIRDVSVRAFPFEPRSGGETREARRAARYGPGIIYLIDGSAWVEPGGTWIAGGSNAEFMIASDRQAPIHLFVRNAPVENEVTLESADWREKLTMRAGEERIVVVPIDDRQGTPLKVAATKGFRPSELDRKSEDERYLGVWIETR